ncbi:MAG: prepilin-type N-terminal cleavage/methylation domain-containing protein, partial [Planctomycetota bacterium]
MSARFWRPELPVWNIFLNKCQSLIYKINQTFFRKIHPNWTARCFITFHDSEPKWFGSQLIENLSPEPLRRLPQHKGEGIMKTKGFTLIELMIVVA